LGPMTINATIPTTNISIQLRFGIARLRSWGF